ncbi:hypothetical protein [Anthocerotibacter panamensis]|uniref:hypothetical protein n=1 Tax=Anthocerotibacter panamensis TaxID=2857077 RepID=UPI001C408BDE|nr:hypothetical protein [Anthocerotibacter panamensis]
MTNFRPSHTDDPEARLVQFLQAHAPLPPAPQPDLEERILQAIQAPEVEEDHALVAFLQTYAPEPIQPPPQLEERIFRAVRQPPTRNYWWQGLAAAGVAASLVFGFSRFPNPETVKPVHEPEVVLDDPSASPNASVFAVDPETGLFDVRI